MKKCLIALVVINILGGVIAGFALLVNNLLYGILGFVGTALSVVPYIALLQAMEDIEDLTASIQVLQGWLHQMRSAMDTSPELSTAMQKHVSQQAWTCRRCNAVNKGGTHTCESCGGRYTEA